MMTQREKDDWLHPNGESLIRPPSDGLSEKDLQGILKTLRLPPFDTPTIELGVNHERDEPESTAGTDA